LAKKARKEAVNIRERSDDLISQFLECNEPDRILPITRKVLARYGIQDDGCLAKILMDLHSDCDAFRNAIFEIYSINLQEESGNRY